MKQMKYIYIVFIALTLFSCRKEEVTPWRNWMKDFGPYDRISADSITFSNDITLAANPKGIVSVVSYTADTICKVHIKSKLNIFSSGDFQYYIDVNGSTKTYHEVFGGVNGFPKLEVDEISLRKGDVVNCYIGYSNAQVTVNRKGSYFLVEKY
jgi:hypothetical protein